LDNRDPPPIQQSGEAMQVQWYEHGPYCKKRVDDKCVTSLDFDIPAIVQEPPRLGKDEERNRIIGIYGSWGNGCGCCETKTLKEALDTE
jgi:hypothetical protein